jgi:hypothetical protein
MTSGLLKEAARATSTLRIKLFIDTVTTTLLRPARLLLIDDKCLVLRTTATA